LVVPVEAFTGKYSHYSENEDIGSVLLDFARSQGYNAKVSTAVHGNISGKFDSLKPEDFLQILQSAFGVKYFIQGKIINFYHDTEWTQTVYKPSAVDCNSLVNSLRKAHILADSLPVEIDSSGLIIIQGPDSYVSSVVAAARSFDQGQENDMVMQVFKLKHAKAKDIDITTASKRVVVPGVATLLQKMVSGADIGANSMTVSMKSQVMTGLRGKGLSATAPSDKAVPEKVASGEVSQSGSASFSPNIIPDERLNAVLIYDYKYRMPFYKSVIEEIDVPVRMVELHAAVIDVDVDATDSLGISLQGSREQGNWTLDGSSGVIGTTNGGFIRTDGGVFSTVFNTDRTNFMMQISALESDGRAKTLGKPSILTMDNVEATLENTTTNYVPVSGNESSDLFSVTAGTVLQVNPHIIDSEDGGDPVIQMIITLKTNQDSSGNDIKDAGSGTSYVPSVKETVINTQAMVKQGQSLLIGGYYIETKTEKEDGVPVLKDIPLIGRLFSRSTEVHQKRERILLITPRIVSFDNLNALPEGIDGDFYHTATQTDYSDVKSETQTKVIPARDENTAGCASVRSSSPVEKPTNSSKVESEDAL
jgi:type III secretion protein C